ncbi:Mur ligase family protein [Sporosarcina sp. CAU 1771]
MNIHILLPAIQIEEIRNSKEAEITGLAYDSRKVESGNLFVCIKGFKMDGHRFAGQAVEQGATVLVVEDFIDDVNVMQIRVEDSRVAMAALADTFYGHPSRKLKTIGITATNGKTSTAFMTNAILEKSGFKTGLMGTIVVKIGDYAEPSDLTTPESLDLHRFFGQMVKEEVTHTTMEVSSSALELNRVGSVDFDIVTLNNISREHIDLHDSFDNYLAYKTGLIRNARKGQTAILNLDDSYSAALVDQTEADVVTIGVERQDADIRCTTLDLSTGRATFTVEISEDLEINGVHIPKQQFDIRLATPGFHSVYNSMVAITIGLLCEVPVEKIQESLAEFVGVERRFEIIFEDDFKIIDDHFANSGNIDVTLGTLEKMDYEKVRLVYAIRGDRGVTVNKENAETIAKWASKLGFNEVIATRSISHVTEKDFVHDEEMDVFLKVMKKANIQVELYDELPDAILDGIKQAEKDDIVLLAGCQGMDYGAKVALEQLQVLRPELNQEKLFKPLAKRVAGNE